MVWVWTPEISEALEGEIRAALARAGASRVIPARPVALVGVRHVTGWIHGRMRLDDGTWLGLVLLHRGYFFEAPVLGWHRAEELRTLD